MVTCVIKNKEIIFGVFLFKFIVTLLCIEVILIVNDELWIVNFEFLIFHFWFSFFFCAGFGLVELIYGKWLLLCVTVRSELLSNLDAVDWLLSLIFCRILNHQVWKCVSAFSEDEAVTWWRFHEFISTQTTMLNNSRGEAWVSVLFWIWKWNFIWWFFFNDFVLKHLNLNRLILIVFVVMKFCVFLCSYVKLMECF